MRDTREMAQQVWAVSQGYPSDTDLSCCWEEHEQTIDRIAALLEEDRRELENANRILSMQLDEQHKQDAEVLDGFRARVGRLEEAGNIAAEALEIIGADARKKEDVHLCGYAEGFARKIRAVLAGQAPAVPSRAATDVLAERRRQIEVEGWTPKDDAHQECGELAKAAICYLLAQDERASMYRRWWPWGPVDWKPKDRRRNLVRAAALIIAEIERLDRAALAAAGKEGV